MTTADIKRVPMEFLYKREDSAFFMDPKTYQEIEVDTEVFGGAVDFVRENTKCTLVYANGKVCAVEFPAE